MTTWSGMGFYYGYPSCCIDAFIIRAGLITVGGLDPSDVDDMCVPFEHEGEITGYMMCQNCAKLPREQLIETINGQRDGGIPPFHTLEV